MHRTVEWSPKLAAVQSLINATHFVLPDLPTIYTDQDRINYFHTVPQQNRIQTISACRHSEKTLRSLVFEADRILIVGGNDKNSDSKCTLSTVEAARILQTETDIQLWGVTNPNDAKSIERVHEKINAGITGFITQPLLSSHALDILNAYPHQNAIFLAGMAMPTTNRDLQFWLLKLLEQPELESDALFKSHMAFFQSPYFSSMAWVRRELYNLEMFAHVDGVHFMPLNNVHDLVDLLKEG